MPRTHGLRSTYVAGCRCDQCRAANREYGRKKSRITDLTPAHREAQRAAQEASVEAATMMTRASATQAASARDKRPAREGRRFTGAPA